MNETIREKVQQRLQGRMEERHKSLFQTVKKRKKLQVFLLKHNIFSDRYSVKIQTGSALNSLDV
jgi:hypothetical protein